MIDFLSENIFIDGDKIKFNSIVDTGNKSKIEINIPAYGELNRFELVYIMKLKIEINKTTPTLNFGNSMDRLLNIFNDLNGKIHKYQTKPKKIDSEYKYQDGYYGYYLRDSREYDYIWK